MKIILRGKVCNNDSSLTQSKIRGSIVEKEKKGIKSENQWTWSGYWAYDSIPDDILTKKRTRKRKTTGARPFVYKFCEVKDASTILVPSQSYFLTPNHGVNHNNRGKRSTSVKKKIYENSVNKKVGDIEFSTQNSSLLEHTNISKKDGLCHNEDPMSNSVSNISLITTNDQNKNETNEVVEKKELRVIEPFSKITFATTSPGDTYTDAGSTTHLGKCPVGGCWKGYFENVPTQKNKYSSRVSETFYLFFNSTPPKDACLTFEYELDRDNKNSCFTSDYLHVSGTGTNLFGTFEILGGYVVETGVLTCERIYIIPKNQKIDAFPQTNEVLRSTSKECLRRSRRMSLNSYLSGDNDNPTALNSNRYSRKRQPTCKRSRYTNNNSEGHNLINQQSICTQNYTKKRSRISSESPGLKKINLARLINLRATNIFNRECSINSISAISMPNHIPATSFSKSLRKVKFPRNNTDGIHSRSFIDGIPPTGNPLWARWRSAHFFYDEKLSGSLSSSDNCNVLYSNISPRTLCTKELITYLVYEGEMNCGKKLRDGFGVCLYNNSVIYEGEWKNNKEHGRGLLITGDRRRIIYEGEWDRSKIHGKGTYSYYFKPGETNTQNIDHWNSGIRIGVYCGDFKENVRHGIGKYTFADGSVYNGEWRDNAPSGKGTFSWTDSSVYNGQWKNGKKHGQGILRTYNGFFYDGTWVDNELEGRGMAVYPSGQTYEGMFSRGKREGRGTIKFTNGAIYEGRFRDDCIEGQGTLKMNMNVVVPKLTEKKLAMIELTDKDLPQNELSNLDNDFMIPIEFQSDIGHIHEKAGFNPRGT